MITINFNEKRNELEQEVGYIKPILEIEEVPCLLDKPYEGILSEETKKYSQLTLTDALIN